MKNVSTVIHAYLTNRNFMLTRVAIKMPTLYAV